MTVPGTPFSTEYLTKPVPAGPSGAEFLCRRVAVSEKHLMDRRKSEVLDALTEDLGRYVTRYTGHGTAAVRLKDAHSITYTQPLFSLN